MNIYSALKIPQVIYSTTSEYNGQIDVVQTGDTKKIKVNGITQSLSFNSKLCAKLVWGKLADLLYREAPNANSVLILGLGGGTIQQLISHKMPNTHITSVEIDKKMVEIAQNFFDLNSMPNHNLIIGDALGVIIHPENYGINKQSFNVVVIDIYVGETYPDLGKSGNFLNHIKDMLVPGGLVIFNRIYTTHHQADVDMFIKQVENFFTNVQTETVPGYTNSDNILVYARSFEHKIQH